MLRLDQRNHVWMTYHNLSRFCIIYVIPFSQVIFELLPPIYSNASTVTTQAINSQFRCCHMLLIKLLTIYITYGPSCLLRVVYENVNMEFSSHHHSF